MTQEIYKDKNGVEIKPGMTLKHNDGDIDVVFSSGDEMGFNASNPKYAEHEGRVSEIYPLHQFNLNEWEIEKDVEPYTSNKIPGYIDPEEVESTTESRGDIDPKGYAVCQTPHCQQTYGISTLDETFGVKITKKTRNIKCLKCGGVVVDGKGHANLSRNPDVIPVVDMVKYEAQRKQDLADKREQIAQLNREIEELEEDEL